MVSAGRHRADGVAAPATLGCARLALGAYLKGAPVLEAVELCGPTGAAQFQRVPELTVDCSFGFDGTAFLGEIGGVPRVVLSYAGSELDEYGADWLANLALVDRSTWIGSAGVAGLLCGPVGGAISLAALTALRAVAENFFDRQRRRAVELAEAALDYARRNAISEIGIVGHSLGGGLAQIAASQIGLPAVTFCSAYVAHVPGVADAYACRPRQQPIVNVVVANDPINATAFGGAHLGRTVTLPSRRSPLDAHCLRKTIRELAGDLAHLGYRSPLDLA